MIILNWYALVVTPSYDEDIGGIHLPELIRLGCSKELS
jgi:hypothetical protein